jgi:dipeptidyl aminopeptidase/acylaminoacyl peptidase
MSYALPDGCRPPAPMIHGDQSAIRHTRSQPRPDFRILRGFTCFGVHMKFNLNFTRIERVCLLGMLAVPLVMGSAGSALAQSAAPALVTPPAALVLDGVPPVPKSVADQVVAYTDFRPTSFASWHPTKMEMVIVRRHKNTPQIYRLSAPGATAELMTDYAEPVRAGSFAPRSGNYFLFGKDTGGNEVNRVWRKDVGSTAAAEPIGITPANKRVQGLAWANTTDRVVYNVVPVNRQGSADTIKTEVFIADPLKPEDAKKIAELNGGGWFGFTFSPDDKALAYFEFVSANESYIWLMDVESGKPRRLTEKNGTEPVAYGDIAFSGDGKHLFTATDRSSEFQRLTMIEIATGKQTTITKDINWDVQSIDVSRDGKLIAFVINEDGTGKLRIMRTADNTYLPEPKLPLGTIGGISWHRNSTDLGFSIVSATSPSEVYSLNAKTSAVTRWTTHEKLAVDAATFPEPELVRWKSFDGRMISGFLYRAPAAKFPGKRPLLISVHGGPEAQSTTGFLGRNNYFLNEMGISIIYPNVRGSSGYGK